MAKKKQNVSIPIKDGLFFPDDFKELKSNHLIYIRDGILFNFDKMPKNK